MIILNGMNMLAAPRQSARNATASVQSRRLSTWVLAFLFLGVLGLALRSMPLSAQGGTVPPPPPDPVTVLVGPVETVDLPNNTLVVAGVAIATAADTLIDERVGPLQAGAWARVEGNSDGSGGLVALRIKVLPAMPLIKLIGPLDSISDTELVVDGIPVNRSTTTIIIGDLVPGEDTVSLRAAIESTGSLLALQVVKVDPLPDDDDDDDDDPSKTKLVGIVDTLPATGEIGIWLVSGIPVEVTAETEIRERVGQLIPGAWVKIKGTVVDGTLVAEEIKTTHTHRFHKLSGQLTGLTALDVTVDGIDIALSDGAAIRGNPQAGERVHVKGTLSITGQLVAILVQGRGNGGDPTPPPTEPGLVIRFTGPVEQLPDDGLIGTWTVAGRTITVPSGAFIDEHKGQASPGAFVEVTALLGQDNSITAVLIVVLRSNDDDDDDDDRERRWVEFRGTVTSLPADNSQIGEWGVDERTVLVGRRTRIDQKHQPIVVGDEVKVWGWRLADGTIRAARIASKAEHNPPVHVVGTIEALPAGGVIGLWTVDGRSINVTDATELKTKHGDFAVGVRVKVHGRQGQDGAITASKIESLPLPEIHFKGHIVSQPAGSIGEWTIGEKQVVTNEQTDLRDKHGPLIVGTLVKVKGVIQPDGTVLAREIETQPLPKVEKRGEIRSLPADPALLGLWEIGPHLVEVSANTELKTKDGDFAVGVRVKVHGRLRADGVILAEKIETLRNR